MWRLSPNRRSSEAAPGWVAWRVRVRAVAYPKSRCPGSGRSRWSQEPPPVPSRARLLDRSGAFPRVGDQLAVDPIGQATFQAPQRLQGCLALGTLAPVVGASVGVVAELDDAGHVQHVVQPPVARPGQAVVGVFAAGSIDGS